MFVVDFGLEGSSDSDLVSELVFDGVCRGVSQFGRLWSGADFETVDDSVTYFEDDGVKLLREREEVLDFPDAVLVTFGEEFEDPGLEVGEPGIWRRFSLRV